MNSKIHPQAGDYHTRREELKEIYRINDAWKDIGIEGEPAKSCRCPWREDHKPSFSVYNKGRSFKDFSTDDSGDVFNFVMLALGLSFKEAVEWIEERNGRHSFQVATRPPRRRPPSPPKPKKELKLPPLDRGNTSDIEKLSKSRRITPYSLNIAVEIETLRFGTICGHRSWILTDPNRNLAEARRLDGRPFDAVGTLPARKAHTLAGSSKAWPFGLTLAKGMATPGATILLVEGGPDYLAAFDFLTRLQRQGFQPVAMLGKSNRFPADALELMAGRRVRIYPHHDPGGGGMEAAKSWFRQLSRVGCTVDGFSFEGLTRLDGKPVTDLNDLLLADEASRAAWKGILP
ncbi:CHC2 zinc finger domain-containing protein [Akkermansiaceae bacterium]|nr:CHC2 zinc finger domain-containing protein [Akkermansiaceae bacterium]